MSVEWEKIASEFSFQGTTYDAAKEPFYVVIQKMAEEIGRLRGAQSELNKQDVLNAFGFKPPEDCL